MKFLCSLGCHNWETTQSCEFRDDQYELFGRNHGNVQVGILNTQKCKRCGKDKQKISHFTLSEIILHMLKETNEGLKEANDRLKQSNLRIKDGVDRLKESNKSLRESIDKMEESVKRLKAKRLKTKTKPGNFDGNQN